MVSCNKCDVYLEFIGVMGVKKWKYQCPVCHKITIKDKMYQENMEYLHTPHWTEKGVK